MAGINVKKPDSTPNASGMLSEPIAYKYIVAGSKPIRKAERMFRALNPRPLLNAGDIRRPPNKPSSDNFMRVFSQAASPKSA